MGLGRWGAAERTFYARLEQHAAPFSQHCTLLSFPVCGCSFHSLYPCKTPTVTAINELLSADQRCSGQSADYPVHKGCRRLVSFETWEAFVPAEDNRSSNLQYMTYIQQRLASLFCATSTVIVFFTSVASTHVLLHIPAPGYCYQQGHARVIKRQSVIALQTAMSKQKGELENS